MKKALFVSCIILSCFGALILLSNGCGTTSSGGSSVTSITRLYLANQSDGVIVFNVQTSTMEGVIYFPDASSIYGVALSTDKRTLYGIDSSDPGVLYSFLFEAGTVVTSVPVETAGGDYPGCYVFLSPDSTRAFIPGNLSSVFVFKTNPLTLEAYASAEGLEGWCAGGVVKGNYAYIADSDNALILKYDITLKTIVATVEVPNGGEPYFIRLNPAQTKIYVPGDTANEISILDVATFTFDPVIITVEAYPTDIGFSSNGKIYETNYYGNSVLVINSSTNTIIKKITHEAMGGPDCLIVDDARGKVYVNDYNNPVLFVINSSTDTIEAVYGLPSLSDQIGVKSAGERPRRGRGMAF
jgi:YVTN family beta-propeller protein